MFNTILGIGLLSVLVILVGTIVILGWTVEGPRRFFKYLANQGERKYHTARMNQGGEVYNRK